MNRWIWFIACALLALGMLGWGLLVPVHVRAVESSVLQSAGGSPSVVSAYGLELVREQQLGAAQLLLQALPSRDIPDYDKFRAAVNTLSKRQPVLQVSGGDVSPRMDRLFASDPQTTKNGFESLAQFVIRLENREVILELLRSSSNPAVQELLRCRGLTNTAIFAPSMSSAGQAFDAAVSITALLIDENLLSTRLRDTFSALATSANHGSDSQPLEQALLDMMSLGQRLNWGQLAAFAGHIEDTETLRRLADEARNDSHLPVLFAAVQMSGRPAAVAHYLQNFTQSGVNDLASSLRYGPGGVKELLKRDQRLTQSSDFARRIVAMPVIQPVYEFGLNCARWTPGLAFALKWLAYLSAGFFLAAAFHFARPEPSALEEPLQVRGFHVAREVLFALGFLLVVLLLNEPFLAQESQKMELPFRLHLPTLGSMVPASTSHNQPLIMNQSIITLLLFFVLQGLLYIGSLVKLAEIRRQNAPARIKLKLLENEDHLFDAGLYLGFLGTIVAFMYTFLSKGNLSLIGAYSSTSFGIVFVSIFKIFQLRPARRKLLLEAEADAGSSEPPAAAPGIAPALATMP